MTKKFLSIFSPLLVSVAMASSLNAMQDPNNWNNPNNYRQPYQQTYQNPYSNVNQPQNPYQPNPYSNTNFNQQPNPFIPYQQGHNIPPPQNYNFYNPQQPQNYNVDVNVTNIHQSPTLSLDEVRRQALNFVQQKNMQGAFGRLINEANDTDTIINYIKDLGFTPQQPSQQQNPLNVNMMVHGNAPTNVNLTVNVYQIFINDEQHRDVQPENINSVLVPSYTRISAYDLMRGHNMQGYDTYQTYWRNNLIINFANFNLYEDLAVQKNIQENAGIREIPNNQSVYNDIRTCLTLIHLGWHPSCLKSSNPYKELYDRLIKSKVDVEKLIGLLPYNQKNLMDAYGGSRTGARIKSSIETTLTALQHALGGGHNAHRFYGDVVFHGEIEKGPGNQEYDIIIAPGSLKKK